MTTPDPENRLKRANLGQRYARDFVRAEELTKSQMYEMLADAARLTAKLPKKPKGNRHV